MYRSFIFGTFLILLLFLFGITSAFSATYTYYQSGNQCNFVHDSFCNQTFAAITNPNKEKLSCTANATDVRLSYKTFKINSVTFAQYDIVTNNPAVALTMKHTCQAGEKFELIGCTPKCVIDPCAPLKDQDFSGSTECGNVVCPNDGKLVSSGSGIACDKGRPNSVFVPNSSATKDGCLGNYKSHTERALVMGSDIGKTSAKMYCPAVYTYTGSSSDTPTVTPADLVALSAIDAIPTTEDGTCPPEKPLKGQFNGGWACFPNDQPTDNPCPSGQVPNNNGVCVPYDEAGQCLDGQVRNADGVCITPDPDGGNGEQCGQFQTKVNGVCVDNGTGGGSGGSGGGGSGGGSGGSGGDDEEQEATPDSTEGAGGKTSASTAEGCGTPPACDGDPLACASFVQDWKQNCQMMSISQSDADKANALGTASNQEYKTAKTAKEVKVSGFFADFKTNATASLTSSQCPTDLSLSVMGKSLVIPFSTSCDFWRLLRLLVIASAYLASASIVFRSFA